CSVILIAASGIFIFRRRLAERSSKVPINARYSPSELIMVLLIMVLTRKTKPKVTAYKKTIPTCRSSKKLTKQQMLYELKKKGMILPLRTTKAVVKQLHVFAGNGNFNKHAQRDDSSSIRSSPAGSWPLFVSRTVANLDDDEDTTEMNVTKIAPRTYTLYNCINSKARGGTDYLLSRFQNGFQSGAEVLPTDNHITNNLRSARDDPDTVTKLLTEELKNNYLIGSFDYPPFEHFRISPLGLVFRKYSGKARLILDLSSPHKHPPVSSINDLIDSEESMTYTTIDDAISTIQGVGRGAWLCKCDIKDAFKLLPLHPRLWSYYGCQWNSKCYFWTRLPFGSRSSPRIFHTLSQAIVWIFRNDYHTTHIHHLLDDVLVIDATDEEGYHRDALSNLNIWINFLETRNANALFLESTFTSNIALNLYTDASGGVGFDGILGREWFTGKWEGDFIPVRQHVRESSLLEIGPVYPSLTKAVQNRLQLCTFREDQRCYNLNIISICKQKHIPGITNTIADALSRADFARLRELAPYANEYPCDNQNFII
ncbi:unnamed protein product, partial [Didymodactylos carnosus]